MNKKLAEKIMEMPEKYKQGYFFNEKLHLHLYAGKPLTGTSSVGDGLAKNLTWWAAELSAVECLESGEHIPTIRQEYLDAKSKKGAEKKKAIDALCLKYPIFKKARFAHYENKKTKANEGADLHAELEKFVKSEMGIKKYQDSEFHPRIKPFVDWSRQNVKKFLWSEANCYELDLWVGGVSDWGAELNNGMIGVFDAKSSEEVYPSQFIQAGGYVIQIDTNGLWDAKGEKNKKLDKPIDFIAIVPFGAEIIEPQIRYEVEAYKNGFRWAMGLYRLMDLDKQLTKKI